MLCSLDQLKVGFQWLIQLIDPVNEPDECALPQISQRGTDWTERHQREKQRFQKVLNDFLTFLFRSSSVSCYTTMTQQKHIMAPSWRLMQTAVCFTAGNNNCTAADSPQLHQSEGRMLGEDQLHCGPVVSH